MRGLLFFYRSQSQIDKRFGRVNGGKESSRPSWLECVGEKDDTLMDSLAVFDPGFLKERERLGFQKEHIMSFIFYYYYSTVGCQRSDRLVFF